MPNDYRDYGERVYRDGGEGCWDEGATLNREVREGLIETVASGLKPEGSERGGQPTLW